MNEKPNNSEMLDDDARFDRLVDGELSAEEYRALLAGLDDEPGGWRRCALAFLESQALGREVGAIRRSGQIAEPAAEAMVASRAMGGQVWILVLAMAASFLVAFVLGVYGPGLFQPAGVRPPLAGPVAPPTSPSPASPQRSLSPVGNVRLVVNGPGGTTTDAGELPVYEMNDETARWLQQDQPAIPVEWVHDLERRGHRVERERQYVPLVLDDGRQVIVPVEGYQITPAGRQPY